MRRVMTAMLSVLVTASVASADVLTVASPFAENSVNRSYEPDDNYVRGFWVSAELSVIEVTGLAKFDPSLGTLTGVAVSIDSGYEFDLSVQADGVIDSGQPHSISAFYLDAVEFRVRREGETFVRTIGLSSGTQLATGNAGDAPAFELIQGAGAFEATSVNITNQIDLSDFIGVDDVENLQVAIYLPYDMDLTLTNVASGGVQVNAEHQAGTVSLHYTYVPVPEPASLTLLGLGTLVLLKRRRA